MRFHCLYVSSVSACFELENTSPYYAEEAFDVTVNGAPALEGVRTNVFSLFDLKPETEYTVAVGGEALSIHTKPETGCVSVRDFGAVGDGVTDDTVAIQNAIHACPRNGRVQVSPGTYAVRPLVLKSHMTLELQSGAVLLGDTCEEHYPLMPGEVPCGPDGQDLQISSWEGNPMPCRQSFISAFHAHDITVVGRGIIDGNAPNSTWWENVKTRSIGRPRLVFLNRCQKVRFHGILGRNSASWNFHPYFCQDLGFYDMAVEAPKDSPNTDGTDPESCDDVRYVGVRFSVGDDAIAIKSGKMYMGMRYKTPATRHVVRNCLMEYAHGAMVLGSEMSGGIKDLTVSQCYFKHTDRGLRIKTRRGRGKYAVIDGVEFSNIRMDNVMAPLVMNMYYFCDPDGHEEIVWSKEYHPVDDTTPYLGSFRFRDMDCTDCEWAAGYFYGLTEQPIGSVTIENVRFTFKEDAQSGRPAMMDYIDNECKRGLYFNGVHKVILKNVTMEGQVGERITAIRVDEVIDE
ncbi:MAG: glycoside hydrolase family 28 protein [Oscillospiraceae bacterium]|nr:glycoside hydrolase family 28 protein [Oscillospiraceae bacterium]